MAKKPPTYDVTHKKNKTQNLKFSFSLQISRLA